MGALGVCLALLTGSMPPVFVPAQNFTLAWVHSIEKVRWEEDYAVVAGSIAGAPPQLRAVAARVRGSAAGMEPPEGAKLRNGWFEYTPPALPTPEGLRLTRSVFTPDYDWCMQGRCEPLSRWLPSDGHVTLLRPCHDPRVP
jgi:hypothetical protein